MTRYLLWSGIVINALVAFWLIFGLVASVKYELREWRKEREARKAEEVNLAKKEELKETLNETLKEEESSNGEPQV